MSYVYGQGRPTTTEAARQEMENRKLVTRIQTAKTDRDRLQATLKQVRQEATDARTTVDRARTTVAIEIEMAGLEATEIILRAEREADTIRERAHRQAWALRDRAYTDGATRRLDQAKARTTVLRKH